MRLNDRMFSDVAATCGGWRSLGIDPGGKSIVEACLEEAIKVLAGEYGDSAPVVLEYPRFSKRLPLWSLALEKLNYRVCHIIPVHQPDELAGLSFARIVIPASFAKLAWARYYLDAKRRSRAMEHALYMRNH
jgi:hypothetical protein